MSQDNVDPKVCQDILLDAHRALKKQLRKSEGHDCSSCIAAYYDAQLSVEINTNDCKHHVTNMISTVAQHNGQQVCSECAFLSMLNDMA